MDTLYAFITLVAFLLLCGSLAALPFRGLRNRAVWALAISVTVMIGAFAMFARTNKAIVNASSVSPGLIAVAEASAHGPEKPVEPNGPKKPGRVRVCLTNDDVPISKIREITLPPTTVFRDGGRLTGDRGDFHSWGYDSSSVQAAMILVEPIVLTAERRCADGTAKMLIAPLSEATHAAVADNRVFDIDDVLEYPIPAKRPGIEFGKLVDDISVKAILLDDITDVEQRPAPSTDTDGGAARCLSEAQKLAAAVKGVPGRQTSSVVFIQGVSSNEMSYGCSFGPKRATDIYVSWDRRSRPSKQTSDLIAQAGEFLTGGTQAEMRQETDACVSQALKADAGEMSDREFRGVKIECQAFARDGGGGSVTVYRRFGVAPDRPDLSRQQLSTMNSATAAAQADADAQAAKSLAFARWWQDPAIPLKVKTIAMMTARMVAVAERCPTWQLKQTKIAELAAWAGTEPTDFKPQGKYYALLMEMTASMKAGAAGESREDACRAAQSYN